MFLLFLRTAAFYTRFFNDLFRRICNSNKSTNISGRKYYQYHWWLALISTVVFSTEVMYTNISWVSCFPNKSLRRVSRNRSRGGGISQNFLLGLLKCRIPYLQRTVMERCIIAWFLLFPYSYEHIGRQYTCPRLYSVHWFDDLLKVISPI